MAEPTFTPDPAVGMIELASIATGVLAGDAMIKSSPLGSIYAGTVHPGRYLILVSGDTASVEIALDTGLAAGGDSVLDSMILPDIHPEVASRLVTTDNIAVGDGEAIGVVETSTVSAVVYAADAGVKAASVAVASISLADGLGGKGYVIFAGVLAEVEAAVEAAVARAEPTGKLLDQVVVARLAAEMRHNLASDLYFNVRLAAHPDERG